MNQQLIITTDDNYSAMEENSRQDGTRAWYIFGSLKGGVRHRTIYIVSIDAIYPKEWWSLVETWLTIASAQLWFMYISWELLSSQKCSVGLLMDLIETHRGFTVLIGKK